MDCSADGKCRESNVGRGPEDSMVAFWPIRAKYMMLSGRASAYRFCQVNKLVGSVIGRE